MGNFLKYVNGKAEEDKKKASSVDIKDLRKNLIENKTDFFSSTNKKQKEEEKKTPMGSFGKYAMEQSIGLETFASDLSSMGTTIGDIYNGWQTPETMKNTRESIASMQKRLNAYQEYQKIYGGADLSEIASGYNDLLADWDDRTKTYGKYKSADEYDNAMKLAKAEIERRASMPSANLDEIQAEIDRLKGIEEQAKPYADAANKAIHTRNTSAESLENIRTSREKLEQFYQDNGFANADELAKAISEKSQYKNQAKLVQDSIKLSKDIRKDADYEKYASAGEALGNEKADGWFVPDNQRKNSVAYLRNNPDAMKAYEKASKSANGLSFGTVERQLTEGNLEYKAAKYGTDEQLKDYYAYLGKGDEENALKYLQSIEQSLNEAMSVEIADDKDNIWKQISFSGAAGLDQFEQGTKNLFNFSDDYIPTSPTQLASGQVREKLDEVGFDNVLGLGSSLGQMVYDLGTTTFNMAPSILASSVSNMILPGSGAIVGGVTMGASAAGNAYQEKINQGWDKDQARVYSTAIGISEGALQYALGGISSMGGKLSGKSIQAMATGIDNALVRYIATMGIKGMSEGIEESLQEIIAPFIENLALGYAKNDWSDVELAEVAYSGLLGALSAGLLEGGGTAVEVFGENHKAKGIGATVRGNEKVGDVFDIASLTPQESDAYNLYTAYAKKGVNAENASDLQLGRLFLNSNKASQEVLGTKKATLAQRDDAIKNLERLSEISKENTLDDDTRNAIKENVEVGREYRDGLISQGLESGENTESYRLATELKAKLENGEEISQKELSRLVKANDNAIKLEEYAQEMSEEDAGLFVEQYDGKMDAEEYLTKFNYINMLADASVDIDEALAKSGSLTPSQVGAIYNARVLSSDVKPLQVALDNLKAKHKNSVFIEGSVNDVVIDYRNGTTDGSKVNWKDLSSTQKKAIRFAKAFAKATGVNIMFTRSKVVNGEHQGENGSYNPDTNTITLDVFAGRIDAKSAKDAIIPTLSHEITHWMKQKAPAIYKAISEEVKNTLAKDGKLTWNERIAKEKDRIKEKHGKEVSDEYAIDELVARACEDMLKNSNQARKLLSKLSVEEQQSLVGKIKETFDNLIGWVNELLNYYNSKSTEATTLRAYKDDLKRISKMWDEMLVSAIESNQALQKEGKTGEQLAREVSNVETKADEVQYDIRETPDGIKYVVLDKDLFVDDSGEVLTPRQAYNALVGQKILLEDGDVITFVKKLPGRKDMYNELFRRYPAFKGQINIKAISESINKNIVETIKASKIDKRNEAQLYGHLGVVDFDKREVYVTDGNVVYQLRLAIANLIDGKKIAYAKSFVESASNDIVKKIKKAETARKSRLNQLSAVEQAIKSATSTTKTIVPQNGSKSQEQNSDRDNLGNDLSEGQAEYFKDSKVRDENGNLLVMYHGTSEDFTIFDKKKARASGTYGRGFYFTRESNHAKHYGEAKEYYLKIDNPLSTKEKTITKAQLKNFLEVIAEDEDYGLENYGYGSTVESIIDGLYDDYDASRPEYRKTDFSILWDVNLTAIGNLVETVELFNKVNGTNFDGFILPTETVTFKSEQAKLTSNKAPTENEDIRYSDRDSAYIDAVEKGDVETASRMIEEAAEKAFSNSKVRGSDGKLRLVYHGTVNDFTVFDRQFANIEGDFGKGYYFTSNEYDVDANYANEDGPDLKNKIARYAERLEWEDESADLSYEEREEIARQKFITSEPNTITAYLNMENPVYITPDEQGTFLDFTEEYDEEYDEYGEPQGLFVDFIEALKNNSYDYAYNDVDFSFLYDHVYDYGGMYASDAVKIIKENIIDELSDENGDLAISEVIRLAFEQIGFDGIIDTSVYYKFRNMDGMDSGTTHYIVFDSNQIKSAEIATYDNDGNVIPLSKRFDESKEDIRYSDRDTAYMDAVGKGDMVTAQKIVDEVAAESGYTSKVYHGTTGFGFTRVNLSKSDDGISFFATDSLELAETYSGTLGETPLKKGNRYSAENQRRYDSLVASFVDKVNEIAGKDILKTEDLPFERYLNKVKKGKMDSSQVSTEMTKYTDKVIEAIEEHKQLDRESDRTIWELSIELESAIYGMSGKSGNYGLYANTENFFEIDGNGAKWSSIPFDKIPSKTTANTREIVKWAKDNGYTGVLFKNIIDVGYHGTEQRHPANVYAFLNPQEQVKSAEPVTYNAFGKVIPLSKRFDKSKKDIRYSDRDSEYMELAKDPAKNEARLREMVYEAAKKAGYTDDSSWRMEHSAPNSKSDVSLDRLKESGLIPDDFWEHPEWYTYSPEERESYYKVKKAIEMQERRTSEGNPRDAHMWVYRAVDKTVNTKEDYFRNGDWVTPSYDYAVNEGKMNPKGYRIIKHSVSIKHLYWDGNSIAELGYDDGNTYAYADTLNNRKLLDPVTYDESGNIIPLSKRFKRRNWDVRYSDRMTESVYDKMGETARLEKENARLKKDLARLKERVQIEKKVTGGSYIDGKYTDLVAGHIRKISDSTYNKDKLSEELREFYSYAQENAWGEDTLFAKAYELAENVLTEAKPKTETNDYAKYLLKEIRSKRISLSETQIQEAKNTFGKNYRNAFWGKVIIANNGISLDSQWQEWAEMYPGTFKADISEGDQITELYNIYDALRDASETIQEYDAEEQTRWLAEEIINKYWTIPIKFTTADKYEARIKVLNFEHRQAMKEMREDYEQRLKEQHKADKTRYKDLVKNIRDRKDAEIARAKELGKERLDEFKESAERKTVVQSILATTTSLNKKLLTNSKDTHIPEALKPVVINLIKAIDFSSKQLLGMERTNKTFRGMPTKADVELEKTFGKTKAMADGSASLKDAVVEAQKMFEDAEKVATDTADGTVDLSLVALDANLKDEISELIKVIDVLEKDIGSEFVLQKMNLEQLKVLKAMVNSINHWATNVDKALAIQHKAGISNLSMQTIEENDVLGERKEYIATIESFKNFFSWSNLLPVNAFKRLGNAAIKVFDSLRDAQDTLAFHEEEITSFTEELFKGKKIQDWRKEVKEFSLKLPNGKTKKVRMPVSYVMSLYCVAKQEDAQRHLFGLDENGNRYDGNGGGMTIKGFKEKLHVSKDTKNTILNEQLVKQITSVLTKEQRDVADKLQNFMNTTGSEWCDTVSMALYGIKKFGIKDYFPITVTPTTIKTLKPQDKRQSVHFFSILNYGFTKSRNPNAKQSIEIGDVFEIFANHMSMMSIYSAYALPIYDMVRWYNFTSKNEDGDEIGVQNSLVTAFGDSATTYISRLISDLNGQHESSRLGFISRIFKNTKIAMVGNSISVALLQPTAYLKAMVKIPTRYLLKSALYVKDFGASKGVKKAKQHCGIALWKSQGNFETDISQNMSTKILHDETIWQKLKRWSLKGAEFMDERTWGILWNACEFEVRAKRKDLKIGSQEFYEVIGKKLRDVIYETQVVDSPLTRSDLMRSPDTGAKMITMFASEITVAYNMVHEAIVDANLDVKRNGKEGAWKRNGKNIAMTLTAYTLTSAVSQILSTAVQGFRDDEDKEFEDYLKMYVSNFLVDWALIGKIPYIKEALNYAQGYSSSRVDTLWLESASNAIKYWAKAFEGKEGASKKAIDNTLKSLSYLSGLPAYNQYRDFMATLNFLNILDAEDFKEMLDEIFE